MHLERYSKTLSVIHPPANVNEQYVLQELEVAAAEGRTLDMHYTKEYGVTPQMRCIDPYGIVYWKGKWYVVGYCHLRQEVRSFRVDRIQALNRSERSFERVAGFSAREFLMKQLLPGAIEAESLIEVRIRGKEQALNDLCQHWLFGHALIGRLPEQAEFRLGLESLMTYVPYFLLPYGKAITIIEPEILIEKMANVTSELALYYQNMKKIIDPRSDPITLQ